MIALTITTFLFLPRYQPVGESLLADPVFKTSLGTWQMEGAVNLDPSEPDRVILENRNPRGRTYLRQVIALPSGRKLVRLKAEVKAEGVVSGDEPWETARIYLVQFDASGAPDWTHPHNLFQLAGTTGVRNYSRVFPVPASVGRVRLSLDLTNATGRMTVGKLDLVVVEERPIFRSVAACLIGAWSLLALYAAIAVFRSLQSRRLRLWLGTLLSVFVVGLLIPAAVRQQIVDVLAVLLGVDLTNRDAIGHGVMFAILACLMRIGRPRDPFLLHLAAWLLIGVASEVLQLFTLGREPSLGDLSMDGIGILLGLALAEILPRLSR